MSAARCLVVAKAPVPGRSKTRLGATVGHDTAARLAAASLLDTMAACATAFGPGRRVLALDGRLSGAVDGHRIAEAARGWRVVGQHGRGLAARLARAHHDAGPGPVVQVGMDTPQLTPALLSDLAALLDRHEAVLGPAEDGGWWALALRDPRHATALAPVPMSTPETGARTREALESVGLRVALAPTLRDVDTASDADAVSSLCPPGTAFAAAWRAFAQELS